MSFDIIRLPVDVETGAKGGPAFQTSIVELSSGNEQRNQDWTSPRQVWDIGYGINNRADYEAVRDFFVARRGRARGFLFKDWSDYKATNSLIGTGTGTKRTFLLSKSYETDGPLPFVRRITRPVDSTLVVRVNGVPSTDWVLGAGGWIRFDIGFAPANGATVHADFEFDVPVRFAVDVFPLTLDWSEAGEIGSLPVLETRDDFNAAPSAINLTNTTTTLPEGTSTVSHIHLADIDVSDDPFGTDTLALTGADAAKFEIVGTLGEDRTGAALYLKAGTVLDYEIKNSYAVTITVDDLAAGGTHPAAHVDVTLTVTDVNEAPSVHVVNTTVVKPDPFDTSAAIHCADVVVVDDTLGLRALTLSGADAASFALSGSLSATSVDPVTGLTNYTGVALSTIAGLDISVQKVFHVTIDVADSGLPSPPQGTVAFVLSFGVVPGTATLSTPGAHDQTVPNYTTLTIEGWGPGAGGHGFNTPGTSGDVDTTIVSLGLTAGRGLAAAADTNIGGTGGVATGGDTNQSGTSGNSGIAFGPQSSQIDPFTGLPVGGQLTTLQFFTAAGGNPGGGLGGGLSSTGAVYTIRDETSDTNVNGNPGTLAGGAGAGSVRYGVSNFIYFADRKWANAYGKGAPSGGGGAKWTKTYVYGVTPGYPNPGDVLACVIGAKGIGGVSFANGGDGANGAIKFTWS